MMAAESGSKECVETLSKHEAGKARVDGCTALMMALKNGQNECAKILIPFEAGKQTINGDTTLMFAVSNNNTLEEIVKQLAEKESGIQNNDG